MCTAISYRTKNHYFGRTLDVEMHYNETVTITPRYFKFEFRNIPAIESHYAIIGMATLIKDYPLYYDATNEKGLSVAGLNFPGNADYKKVRNDADNIASFEIIPWILSRCANVDEAKVLLSHINITDVAFSSELPNATLHWMISDREKSITVEAVKDGLKIYDNPVGVMTNNPTFDMQMFNLNNYMNISSEEPVNRFSDKINLRQYSRGMGAIGLPGDLSSSSRFVRAVFAKLNSVAGDSESESISQFFHILGAVCQQRGLVHLGEGKYEYTYYTSCCNTDRGIYYYTTYENNQITGVDMNKEDLDGNELIVYPLIENQQINMLN